MASDTGGLLLLLGAAGRAIGTGMLLPSVPVMVLVMGAGWCAWLGGLLWRPSGERGECP